MAGARLTEAQWPQIDLDGTVIDIWYVSPFEFHAKPLMPVRFANDRTFEDGTILQVWNGSYDAQRWLLAGTVTAKGAWLEGDAELTVTSTVLLVQPTPPPE